MYAFQWSPDWQLDNTKLWRQKKAKNVIFMLYTDGKISKLGNACFSPFTLSQLTCYCLVIRQTCSIKPVFLMTHVPTQWGFPEILLSSFKRRKIVQSIQNCVQKSVTDCAVLFCFLYSFKKFLLQMSIFNLRMINQKTQKIDCINHSAEIFIGKPNLFFRPCALWNII